MEALPPLSDLPTLNLFSQLTTQAALIAKGAAAIDAHPSLAAAAGVPPPTLAARATSWLGRNFGDGPSV